MELLSKKFYFLFVLLLATSVLLFACSKEDDGKKEEGTDGTSDSSEVEAPEEFALELSNKNEPLEDGHLNYAILLDSPFEGTLSSVFYTFTPDAEIMQFFDENLLATDENYLITNDGAAQYEISEDNKVIKMTIKDDVNWHDGEPVKASDLLYAYEILGHPDYTGTRYTFSISNVVGMDAYHKGEADHISGIEVSDDDRTITISYIDASPSLLSGIWTSPVPRHHVGDVTKGELTMEELVSSKKIRSEPIGFGPYKVAKVVPGESVQFERFEDYWRGKPALQSIILRVLNRDSSIKAFEKGEIDLAEFPTGQYEESLNLSNVELIGRVGHDYDYIGFKLGKWDDAKKENVMDPNAKLSDKRVRQALAMAMDNNVVAKEIFKGLMVPATTAIPTSFTYHDADNPGLPYDPEAAKALLDEAGYVDVDGDGFREDPDGNEFVLTYMAMTGGAASEPIAEHYLQSWEAIGVKVELFNDRLHEYMAFYNMLDSDEPGIDLYSGAWSVGTDPDPSSIHGRHAAYNYTRYVSEENDRLLAAGTSEEAFDFEKRQEIYNEWQALMTDEAWLSPTLYRYNLVMANKRVTNYSMEPGSPNSLPWVWGVSEEEPAK